MANPSWSHPSRAHTGEKAACKPQAAADVRAASECSCHIFSPPNRVRCRIQCVSMKDKVHQSLVLNGNNKPWPGKTAFLGLCEEVALPTGVLFSAFGDFPKCTVPYEGNIRLILVLLYDLAWPGMVKFQISIMLSCIPLWWLHYGQLDRGYLYIIARHLVLEGKREVWWAWPPPVQWLLLWTSEVCPKHLSRRESGPEEIIGIMKQCTSTGEHKVIKVSPHHRKHISQSLCRNRGRISAT